MDFLTGNVTRSSEKMKQTFEVDLDGRVISIETGHLAKQAGGSVVVRSGDSVVLVTACAAENPKPGQGFFPLTVDYREYTYAAGKIPGGFIKREGRMSEKEILTSRLIDRPLRPLFPDGFLNETQIIAMVLSADPETDPAVLAIVGAGAALAISDIPFHHLVTAVRVGMINGKYIANPTYSEARESKLNIVVAGTPEGIVMVEAGAQQVSEEEVLGAIEFGHECCKKIAAVVKVIQTELRQDQAHRCRARDRSGTLRSDFNSRSGGTDRRDEHREIRQARKPHQNRSRQSQGCGSGCGWRSGNRPRGGG